MSLIFKSEDGSIVKFNPYHGRDGRFTSANGGIVTFAANTNTKAGRLAAEREKARQQKTMEENKKKRNSVAYQVKQSIAEHGRPPVSIYHGGDRKKLAEALIAVDDNFDYPKEMKDFMSSKYENGYKKFEIRNEWQDGDTGYVQYRMGNSESRVSYPTTGFSAEEQAKARSGSLKMALYDDYIKKVR